MQLKQPLSALVLTTAALVTPVAAHAGPGHDHSHHQGNPHLDAFAEKAGTYDDLKERRDVEYTYEYRDNASGTSDISTERYLFDGQLSWGEYTTHDKFVFPGKPGVAVQGYDGDTAWTTLDGERVKDKKAVGLAEFMRKTNFYWFAMMQKLQDPGTKHTDAGTREVDGVKYHLVEMTFDAPEGEQSDTYLLYVNAKTHLIDRFLFTLVDFGVVDKPFLMEVEYETFDDIMLPVTRRYTPSNWDGEIPADAVWAEEIMTDITFDHGFKPADFAPPAK